MEPVRGQADQGVMDRRVLFMAFTLGSTAGGFLPMLFGAGSFSAASLLCSLVGGFAGIWVASRIDASF